MLLYIEEMELRAELEKALDLGCEPIYDRQHDLHVGDTVNREVIINGLIELIKNRYHLDSG